VHVALSPQIVILCRCDVLATAFLEFWKRREAVHQYDWDIRPTDESECMRPQFEINIKYRKINPVTQVHLHFDIITQRRSIATSIGCFQQCLFVCVCVFVCLSTQ